VRPHGGYTRRANPVQALYPSTRDLAAKTAYTVQAYAAAGQEAKFKLTRAAQEA